MSFFFDPNSNTSSYGTTFSSIAPVFQDPHVETLDSGVAVKFQNSVSVSSLMASNIQLYTNEATPVLVPNAFAPIAPGSYNSLSRILMINFFNGVQPGTNYIISIANVTDAVGNALPPFVFPFQTNNATTLTTRIPDEPLYVEDHSIRTDIYTNFNAVIETNPAFYVVSSDPDNDNIVIPISYNNGVVTIQFSVLPDLKYLSPQYFKFQYRPIARGMNPWQNVPNVVMSNDGVSVVTLSLPSLGDATPVISVPVTDPTFNYYNNALGNYGQAYLGAPYPTDQFGLGYGTPDIMFFQDGYKYRLKISAAVGYTDSNGGFNPLGADQIFQFLVDPQPMVIDPEEVVPYYPDAGVYEIAELIAQYSQEAQNLLKYKITDTLADLMDNDSVIAQTVQDFVQASTLCALSRIYDVFGTSLQSQVAFGDLTIASNNNMESVSQSGLSRVSATTWCELAGVIRAELYELSNKSGMKAIVRGSKFVNPMPNRKIKHIEWNDWSLYSKPGS